MNNYPRKVLKGTTPARLLEQEFEKHTVILKFFNIIPKEVV